ncbi:hypothetical protein Tco_0719835 [Tanacetum coccineum]
MIVKHFMSEHRKERLLALRATIVVAIIEGKGSIAEVWCYCQSDLLNTKRSVEVEEISGFEVIFDRESKSAEEKVGGMKKNRAQESECVWRIGAGGGEVKGGGVGFGVVKSLLREIPEDVIGESGGETFGVDRGAVW